MALISKFPLRAPKTQNVVQFLENGTFEVPTGVTSLEVHLVGGGGGGSGSENFNTEPDPWGQSMYGMGGGGGYTTTATIDVTPSEILSVTVGRGGTHDGYGWPTSISNSDGVMVRVWGGEPGRHNGVIEGSEHNPNVNGGNGGSGGGGGAVYNLEEPQLIVGEGGTDGSAGGNTQGYNIGYVNKYGAGGTGQGRTTRDFGEPTGTMRARGGDSYYEGVHEANPPRPNHGDGGNGIHWDIYNAQGDPKLANGSSGIALIRW